MSSPMEQKKIEKRTQDEPWGCPVFRYPAKKEQPRKEAELWTVKRRTLDCSVPKTYFFYLKKFFFYPTPATAGSFYRTPPTSSCQNGKLTESSLVQVNKLLLPFLAPPAPSRSLLTLGSAAEEWRWWAGVNFSFSAHCQCLKRKSTYWAGRAIQGGIQGRLWLSPTSAGCRI